jgi:hypothetical protein
VNNCLKRGQALLVLILRTHQVDTVLEHEQFRARRAEWVRGPAGQSWRLETGIDKAGNNAPPARPFYPEVVPGGIPARVNTQTIRAQIDAIWKNQVLRDADAKYSTLDSDPKTKWLTDCDRSDYLNRVNLMQKISLEGLELAYHYPMLQNGRGTPTFRGLTLLTNAEPVYKRLFYTIRSLGWNDLVFQFEGSFCLRGRKTPSAKSPNRHSQARIISNHGFGLALDINAVENKQTVHQQPDMMDPRVVALFEAFGFTWGRCFRTTDPMHFEYV